MKKANIKRYAQVEITRGYNFTTVKSVLRRLFSEDELIWYDKNEKWYIVDLDWFNTGEKDSVYPNFNSCRIIRPIVYDLLTGYEVDVIIDNLKLPDSIRPNRLSPVKEETNVT